VVPIGQIGQNLVVNNLARTRDSGARDLFGIVTEIA